MAKAAPRHRPMPALARRHEPQGAQTNYGKGRGGRPWRRLRDAVLKRDEHLCQPCKAAGGLTLATQVDHIVPKARGGTDAMENLQGICAACHAVKSQREAHARPRT